MILQNLKSLWEKVKKYKVIAILISIVSAIATLVVFIIKGLEYKKIFDHGQEVINDSKDKTDNAIQEQKDSNNNVNNIDKEANSAIDAAKKSKKKVF